MTTFQLLDIHPRQIRKYDTFVDSNGLLHWTAVEDAIQWLADGVVRVRVRYVDGGLGTREWNDVDGLALTVERRAS